MVFVGPSVGQVATVIGPVIIGPNDIGSVNVSPAPASRPVEKPGGDGDQGTTSNAPPSPCHPPCGSLALGGGGPVSGDLRAPAGG